MNDLLHDCFSQCPYHPMKAESEGASEWPWGGTAAWQTWPTSCSCICHLLQYDTAQPITSPPHQTRTPGVWLVLTGVAVAVAGVDGNKMLYNVCLIFGLLCNHLADFSIKLYIYICSVSVRMLPWEVLPLLKLSILQIQYSPLECLYSCCVFVRLMPREVLVLKMYLYLNSVWYTGVILSCSTNYFYSCVFHLVTKPTH